MKQRTIAAGAFKQGCLALLDEVEATHGTIVITKRGRPVARLVPVESPLEIRARVLSELRGAVTFLVPDDELMRPLDEPWEALADLPEQPSVTAAGYRTKPRRKRATRRP